MFFHADDKDIQIADLTTRVSDLETQRLDLCNKNAVLETRVNEEQRAYLNVKEICDDLRRHLQAARDALTNRGHVINTQHATLEQLKKAYEEIYKKNEEMHTTINAEIDRLSKVNGDLRDILYDLCHKVKVTNYIDLIYAIEDLVDKKVRAENDAKVIANLKDVIKQNNAEIVYWQQRSAAWKQQAEDWQKNFNDLKNSYNKEHTVVYRDESGHISCVTNDVLF